MKRIVNGVTYNTDTATMLAKYEWEQEDHNNIVTERGTDILYVTRGGAYFLHKEKTTAEWDESERETVQRIRNEFVPLSPERAHNWLLEGEVEVFSNPFDDPPEATAEAVPGATIYIRVPAALKRRVEEAAGAEKVSGNVWAMRCVEDCLSSEDSRRDQINALADISNIAATFRAHDDWGFTHETARKAFGVICRLAEQLYDDAGGEERFGQRLDQLAADRSLGSEGGKYAHMFKPYED